MVSYTSQGGGPINTIFFGGGEGGGFSQTENYFIGGF